MQPADLNLTTTVTGHQLFLFVTFGGGGAAGRHDQDLAQGLDLLGENMENMHDVVGPPAEEAFQRGRFQFLRAEAGLTSQQQIVHPAMSESHGLIRLECASLEPIKEYETGFRTLIEATSGSPKGSIETLAGVQRPRSYTSHAMVQFAYAHALPPGPGDRYPLAAVTPMNKTDAWWGMDSMHRESFFLPRYDENEKLVVKGHALAGAAGVPCISRRLVHAPEGYGVPGNYDFVGYFEFAEADAPVFRQVMKALRDTQQNPEWKFVLEGPEWWGRRVRDARAFLERD